MGYISKIYKISLYNIYFKTLYFRVIVGNQTVVFAKENDPSILMAPSTGKLIKFLMDDGGHVNAGDPYCEIEVMKMVTTLQANEGGIIQFIKRPGIYLRSYRKKKF